MVTPLSFGGNDLSERFRVIGLERTFPGYDNEITPIGSRGRAIASTVRRTVSGVTVRLLSRETRRGKRLDDLNELMRMLDVDEPKPLYLPDEHGLYRMAIPNGDIDVERFANLDAVEVPFTFTDPDAFGETYTYVTSGEYGNDSASFLVQGERPTFPVIRFEGRIGWVSPARPPMFKVWVYTEFTDSDFLGSQEVDVVFGKLPVDSIVVDCEGKSVTMDGQAAFLTLESDWITLQPHTFVTIENQNTNGLADVTTTIEYTSRW